MATAVKTVLNPKTPEGQLLAGLATAQKFPGVRLFFMRVTKVLMRGKIRKIDDRDAPINAANIQNTVCALDELILFIPKLI